LRRGFAPDTAEHLQNGQRHLCASVRLFLAHIRRHQWRPLVGLRKREQGKRLWTD
jgi:hypothetical protein